MCADQQQERGSIKTEEDYQSSVEPTEQAVVVLGTQCEKDIASIGVGVDMRQRLYAIKYAVMLDSEVAMRQEPNCQQCNWSRPGSDD